MHTAPTTYLQLAVKDVIMITPITIHITPLTIGTIGLGGRLPT